MTEHAQTLNNVLGGLESSISLNVTYAVSIIKRTKVHKIGVP